MHFVLANKFRIFSVQIQSLREKSDMQDLEIKRLNKKATEASALAAVEYSNHRVTKEFVESTLSQVCSCYIF